MSQVRWWYGSLAQSVEQLTFNQLVAGSNPARPTISTPEVDSSIPGRLAQLGEHLPYKEGVTGSSPVTTTKFVSSKDELDGPLAQSVEQLTFNQLVAGSNPARPTIISHR
jgi:hypothetical protein